MKNQIQTILFRWGTGIGYSEWRPDQPQEDWSGDLAVEYGECFNARQVIYHGMHGPQYRTYIQLPKPCWTSPRLNYLRNMFSYKGLEGLLVDVRVDNKTRFHFRSGMIEVDFSLADIPEDDWLVWPVGPKYSCSQLVVCRLQNEGVYWNQTRIQDAMAVDGLQRQVLRLPDFQGEFLEREHHHQIGAWVPPGGTLRIPFKWEGAGPVIATWRFSANTWAPLSQSAPTESIDISNSSSVIIEPGFNEKNFLSRTYRQNFSAEYIPRLNTLRSWE